MELWVNGSLKRRWTNVSTDWRNYNATVPLTGNDLVEVVFTNDCYQNGKDRNLFVDYVIINGQTIQAEGGATVLDKGSGTGAFDRVNVIAGQQALAWNGALRFATGKAMDVGYDANGNMTHRLVAGNAYFMAYDAENHLLQVKRGTSVIATFTYDGDGNRVKSVLNGQVTRFVGNYYEEKGSQVTKYYYAGAQRIAVRRGGTLSYLLGDHLGSTSVVADPNGGLRTRTLYKPFGEVRYQSGALPTEYRAASPQRSEGDTFTGQYAHVDDFGLMYYGARWYDPALGRFVQADTVVPGAGNPSAWDRYAYTQNNPLRYTDPSGHWSCEDSECKKGLKYGLDNLLGIVPENLPDLKHQGTIDAYRAIQIQLIAMGGYKYIRKDGSLKDQALLSIIIAAKFGIFRDKNRQIYGESLEALSNQYHSIYGSIQTPCHGACTFEEQLIWLDTKQGIRDFSTSKITSNFAHYWEDAHKAMDNNHTFGLTDSSWEWGNAFPSSNVASWIEAGIKRGEDFNAGDRYIVGDIVPGTNYYFFVVTAVQNLALTQEDRGW